MQAFLYLTGGHVNDTAKKEKYIIVDEYTESIKIFYLRSKVLNELKEYIDKKGEKYMKHITGTYIYEDKNIKLVTVGLFGDVYEHIIRSHYDEYLGMLFNM